MDTNIIDNDSYMLYILERDLEDIAQRAMYKIYRELDNDIVEVCDEDKAN